MKKEEVILKLSAGSDSFERKLSEVGLPSLEELLKSFGSDSEDLYFVEVDCTPHHGKHLVKVSTMSCGDGLEWGGDIYEEGKKTDKYFNLEVGDYCLESDTEYQKDCWPLTFKSATVKD